jgi:single-strand DNA-binding protein
MDINKVFLIGRLVRDPDQIKYTQSGQALLKFSIAVDRREKKGGEWTSKASFFDITVWGKQAESIAQFLCKGKQIGLDGYLDQQTWEKDGQKYSKVTITATQIQLLGGKNGGNLGQPEPQYDDEIAF